MPGNLPQLLTQSKIAKPIMDGLTIYHRKLPHWRVPGAVYYVTWRLHYAQRLLQPQERTVVMDALKHFDRDRYELHAFVVMDDHVHVLVHPLNDWPLERVIHSWKSFAANRLQREFNRRGAIWQEESYDRIVRDEPEYFEKMNYIFTNPNRRWPDLTEYQWRGAVGF